MVPLVSRDVVLTLSDLAEGQDDPLQKNKKKILTRNMNKIRNSWCQIRMGIFLELRVVRCNPGAVWH
jgi:hypothetical protein